MGLELLNLIAFRSLASGSSLSHIRDLWDVPNKDNQQFLRHYAYIISYQLSID
jgi:hypothetical protein